jgi:hypothetical protein
MWSHSFTMNIYGARRKIIQVLKLSGLGKDTECNNKEDLLRTKIVQNLLLIENLGPTFYLKMTYKHLCLSRYVGLLNRIEK